MTGAAFTIPLHISHVVWDALSVSRVVLKIENINQIIINSGSLHKLKQEGFFVYVTQLSFNSFV